MTSPGNERGFALYYDQLIFSPLLRRLYGEAPYYNVGDWSRGAANQTQACEHLMDRLLSLLPRPQSRILDVGCGLGAGTRRLALGCPEAEVMGINLSDRQIEFASRYCPEARFRQMNATRLELADASCTGILSVEAAFHFSPRLRFLQEAWRVLQPGGCLVLTDMLVHTEHWIGAETIPVDNALGGLDDYRWQCEEVGFVADVLTDVTTVTWDGFHTHMSRWTAAGAEPAELAALHGLAEHLAGVPVTYLLARLRKSK